MVFKGTKSRSAQLIAREVDAIGGNLDAFTGKETVCFNMKVLDEHVPTALEVLRERRWDVAFAIAYDRRSDGSLRIRASTLTVPMTDAPDTKC